MPTYDVTVTKVADTGNHFKEEGVEHPIFTGYTLKGTSLSLPTIGECWRVNRRERNGLAIQGIFTTSVVRTVATNDDQKGKILFGTDNSRYLVDYTLDAAPETP